MNIFEFIFNYYRKITNTKKLGSGLNTIIDCIGRKIVWFKEKNADNTFVFSRLFNAEAGYFNPTLKGSA